MAGVWAHRSRGATPGGCRNFYLSGQADVLVSFTKSPPRSCYCQMLTQEPVFCQSDKPRSCVLLPGPGAESGCDHHDPGGGGHFLGQAPGQLDARS